MANADAVRAVARLMRNERCRRIVFLTGAGSSVSSGIPDFRSPGGMYDTLQPELLTASAEHREEMRRNPTFVVDRELFFCNPLPYHEVRRPFILGTGAGQWKPTLTHVFYRLCDDNGLLSRVYTQNIDGLDFQVGLPEEKIVCVHGSLRRVVCEACRGDPYEGDYAQYVRDVASHIKDIYDVDPSAPMRSTPIACRLCGASAVKPATVLYGGAMPEEFFHQSRVDFRGQNHPDMLFVIGSSLSVYPAASLPDELRPDRPRVLINREATHHFDFRRAQGELSLQRDFFLQGDSDEQVLDLLVELGWMEQLAKYDHLLCEDSRKLLASRPTETKRGES